MSFLRTLRDQPQRHAYCVRWSVLLILMAVTVAGMPQWIVHAHAGDHESALVVVMYEHGLSAYDVASDGPADLPMGDEQWHVHCPGTFSTLLPSTLMSVPCSAPQVDCVPYGLASPVCEGHPSTLYRPPIA